MVKFNDLVAHLAVALDESVGDFVELLRVLRLTAADADDGRAFDWADDMRLKNMFRTRYGPGGGVEVSAATVGFYITALLIEGPRRAAAKEALDMQFAVTPLMPRGKRTERTVCAKTKQHYFGAALAKTLSDRTLFDDVAHITVSTKLGLATLVFKDNVTTMFMSERAHQVEPGMHRSAYLSFDKIRFMFDAISEPEPAARPPLRKRAKAAAT